MLEQSRPPDVSDPVGAVLQLVLVGGVEGEGRVVGAPRRLEGRGTVEDGRLRLRLGVLLGRGLGRRRRRRDRLGGRRGGRGRRRPARDLLRYARATALRRRHRRAVIAALPAVVLDAEAGALDELAAALEDHPTDARQPIAAIVGIAEVYDVVRIVGARLRLLI